MKKLRIIGLMIFLATSSASLMAPPVPRENVPSNEHYLAPGESSNQLSAAEKQSNQRILLASLLAPEKPTSNKPSSPLFDNLPNQVKTFNKEQLAPFIKPLFETDVEKNPTQVQTYQGSNLKSTSMNQLTLLPDQGVRDIPVENQGVNREYIQQKQIEQQAALDEKTQISTWNQFKNAETISAKINIVSNLISSSLSSLSASARNLLTPADTNKIQTDAVNNLPKDSSYATFTKWVSTNITLPIQRLISNRSVKNPLPSYSGEVFLGESSPAQQKLAQKLSQHASQGGYVENANDQSLTLYNPDFAKQQLTQVSSAAKANRQATAQGETKAAIDNSINLAQRQNRRSSVIQSPEAMQKQNATIQQNETMKYLKTQNPSQLIELLVSSPRISNDATPIGKGQVLSAIMSNIADATGLTALMSKLSSKDAVTVKNIAFQAKNSASKQIAAETASNDSDTVKQSKITTMLNNLSSSFSKLVASKSTKAAPAETEINTNEWLNNPMITPQSLAEYGQNSSFNNRLAKPRFGSVEPQENGIAGNDSSATFYPAQEEDDYLLNPDYGVKPEYQINNPINPPAENRTKRIDWSSKSGPTAMTREDSILGQQQSAPIDSTWTQFKNAKTSSERMKVITDYVTNMVQSLPTAARSLFSSADKTTIAEAALKNPPKDSSQPTFIKWASDKINSSIERIVQTRSNQKQDLYQNGDEVL